MSEKQQAERKPAGWLRKWLLGIGFTILGILAYAISDNMFSGYPKYGTPLMNLIALVLLCIGAAVIWIIDERRHRHDEDDAS
ncbi:MAG: hypothetical protein QOD05_1066 [Microbacteriaceae bacterium]|jgi:uncharacterized membrane protein AbrB (regulator of aidB expression)|nr:hypothetical protein [Microbacteriaceae bacterium]